MGTFARSGAPDGERRPPDALAAVRAYHERTKHHFHRYAAGPADLDWDTQPDPFRRYAGAELCELRHIAPGDAPTFEDALAGRVAPAAVARASVSQLFYDSLAISAWKRHGSARWALRVNPSSGNLHPTEGYLAAGPIEGISDTPFVAHYAPQAHALEIRARLPSELWSAIARGLSRDALIVGLASIHWREAWKYGERAFRYCQHDAGHAIGAFAVAAAGLGWRARLADGPGSGDLARLFGLWRQRGPERERAECALVVAPRLEGEPEIAVDDAVATALERLEWRGEPNVLSPAHVEWAAIEAAACATEKPREPGSPRRVHGSDTLATEPVVASGATRALRRLAHRRRSAVAFDGRSTMPRDAFFALLARTTDRGAPALACVLPWSPRVDLALFVHRVDGLDAGLYWLARDPGRVERVRAASRRPFEWQPVEGAPPALGLWRLTRGDFRSVARAVSCHQEIAAAGTFSLGMIADFERSLAEGGAWFYPRLLWECGVVGQALYLAAEASAVRATGIGCFFDDPMHEVLGLAGREMQSLYHLAAGIAVDDPRVQSEPAYGARHET